MNDTIDYQPLQNVKRAVPIVFRHTWNGWFRFASIVYLCLVIAIAIIGKEFEFTVTVAVFYLVYLSYLVSCYDRQLWLRFAAVNGWNVDTTNDSLALLPPSLQFGHSRKTGPAINATLAGQPARLFSYRTTSGYGKYSQTYDFILARVAADKPLPHIFLDSRGLKSASSRPEFSNGQKLQLEGDFDKYFSLTMERGQQIDVLSVLTPDVMQCLKDYGHSEDVEIVGQQLYFIVNGQALDDVSMRQLLDSVMQLQAQINQNIRLATSPGR